MTADEARDLVLEHVLNKLSGVLPIEGINSGPAPELQGVFMAAGYNGANALDRIGYCVQIRRTRGRPGSASVWLRTADGKLRIHSNNRYTRIAAEDEALIRSFFVDLPEDEKYEEGFHIEGVPDSLETDFIVERDRTP
jgi:hypothetical protein